MPSHCLLLHTHKHTHTHTRTHTHLLSTPEHFLRQRACVMASSQPVQSAGGGREGPAQPHMHTRTHTIPLDLGFLVLQFFGPTARSLIYGSCRTRDQREGPTCIYARKVFAEPATKSRLIPGSLSVVHTTWASLPSVYLHLLSHLVVLSTGAAQDIRPPFTLT